MNNNRITPKDRGIIKGAVRRAFSRSQLRLSALASVKIPNHTNVSRPRVKTWYKCETCKGAFAGHEMQVDHVEPIIPVTTTLELMSWDDVINRTWCDPKNLAAICETCHTSKTKHERVLRAAHKKERTK